MSSEFSTASELHLDRAMLPTQLRRTFVTLGVVDILPTQCLEMFRRHQNTVLGNVWNLLNPHFQPLYISDFWRHS